LAAAVVVLEKGDGDHYPCNSRIATGVLNVAHTDPHSDANVLRHAIEFDTEGYATPALADALASIASQSMQWLRAEARASSKSRSMARAAGCSPRRGRYRLASIGRARPDVVLQALRVNLKRRGGEIMLATRAGALRMEQTRCVGVKCRARRALAYRRGCERAARGRRLSGNLSW
jgi:fumarate reductase flavoprotein subunit